MNMIDVVRVKVVLWLMKGSEQGVQIFVSTTTSKNVVVVGGKCHFSKMIRRPYFFSDFVAFQLDNMYPGVQIHRIQYKHVFEPTVHAQGGCSSADRLCTAFFYYTFDDNPLRCSAGG